MPEAMRGSGRCRASAELRPVYGEASTLSGARTARLDPEPFLVEGLVRAEERATQHFRDDRIEEQPPFEVVRSEEDGIAGDVRQPLLQDPNIGIVLRII